MSWLGVSPALSSLLPGPSTLTPLTSPLAAQKRLRDLKSRISAQSKKNFVLERDVRYLDSRIALLIQNRMGGEEVSIVSRGGLPGRDGLAN
jgi:hypothetical protein